MKISVVISVYNEEKLVSDCLQSLMKQTRRADEIIVVDNNCTDSTVALAQAFKVRIIKEKKQGIWAARSTGYDTANGDIIVCTDADARFPVDWLARMEAAFSDNSIVAACGPGRFYDGNLLANRLADMIYMKPFFFLVGMALTTKPLFGSNFAMRRHTWRQVRGEVHNDTEDVFDDIDLTFHLMSLGRIVYDKRLYNHISIRPLRNPLGMLMRYRKGLRSITVHWPEQAPHVLYRRWLASFLSM